jgi:hypothetical protein
MNILFDRSFEILDEKDLEELVEVKKVREYLSLDYKETSYLHNHEGAVNLLADITAMANSRGGYIIIGVEEDKEAADGSPKTLVGIDDGDKETNWIQSISMSNIDEKIIGLQVRDIPLANEKSCVLIQIPNSSRKPHMVIHEKHRSFRIRHGRSNAIIGISEVRDMILNMTSYQSTLLSFIEKRKEAYTRIAENNPFLLLMATPIYIGTDKLDPLNNNYGDLLEKVPGVPDSNYEGIFVVGQAKPRIFGLEVVPPKHLISNPFDKFLKLFRNGNFEFCENYSPEDNSEFPNKPMPIYSYRIAVSLVHC